MKGRKQKGLALFCNIYLTIFSFDGGGSVCVFVCVHMAHVFMHV